MENIKKPIVSFTQKMAWAVWICSCVGSTVGLICTYAFESKSPTTSWICLIMSIALGLIFLVWKKDYRRYSFIGMALLGFVQFPMVYLSFGGVNASFTYYVFCLPAGYGLTSQTKKTHLLQFLNCIFFDVCIYISYLNQPNLIITHIANYMITFVLAWNIIFAITYMSAASSKAVENNLIELYEHDELTGLKNRYFLEKERRLNDFQVVAMFDIDFFKKVNDKFLHSTGDKILQKFAKILKDIESDEIKVFRCGGEEFLLLSRLDVYTTNEIIKTSIIDRVRNELRDPDGNPITVSCGVCFSEDKNTDKIKLADSYLYAAKFGGRNQVCFNGAKIY